MKKNKIQFQMEKERQKITKEMSIDFMHYLRVTKAQKHSSTATASTEAATVTVTLTMANKYQSIVLTTN